MRQTLLSLSLIGLAVSGLVAIDRVSAQSVSGDYSFDGTYWWKDKVAYTRTKVYLPLTYYYENGYKYANVQQFYYRYTLAPINNVTFPRTTNWQERADALMAAIARQKSDARILAIDRDSYLKSQAQLRAAIGEVNISGGIGSLSTSYLPFQGNTLYGPSALSNYTVNSAQALIATTVDLNVLTQANARTLDRHVQGSVDLLGSQQQLIASIVQENARLASLRPNQAVQASASSTGGASARVTVNRGGVATGGPAQGNGNLASPRTATSRPQDIINAGCIKCHAGAAAKGGADLSNVNGLTPAQWREVVRRTQLTDDKRMPPPSEPQLTPEQKDEIRLAQ